MHSERFTPGETVVTRIALPAGIPQGAKGTVSGPVLRDGSYPVVFDLGPTRHYCPGVWLERPGPQTGMEPPAVLEVSGAEELRRDLVLWLQEQLTNSQRDEMVSGGVLRTRHGAQADAYRQMMEFWRRVAIIERRPPAISLVRDEEDLP